MKAINKNTIIAFVLMAISSTGFSQVTVSSATEKSPIELKYIGAIENQPLFRLSLNSNDNEGYLISVKDENNDVLYSELVQGSRFSRKYKLDISEQDIDYSRFKVTFEITSKKTNKTTTYSVTKDVHVTQDILVAKL